MQRRPNATGFLIRDTSALNLGFAVALLWTLHPLNTEAVDYLTQRTELMMALFYLLTLYASIRALAARGESPARHRGRRCARLARRDEREYREYLNEEQRSQTGCSAGRMQPEFHHGLLSLV